MFYAFEDYGLRRPLLHVYATAAERDAHVRGSHRYGMTAGYAAGIIETGRDPFSRLPVDVVNHVKAEEVASDAR